MELIICTDQVNTMGGINMTDNVNKLGSVCQRGGFINEIF